MTTDTRYCRRCRGERPTYATDMDNRPVVCCRHCGQRIVEGARNGMERSDTGRAPRECYHKPARPETPTDPLRRPAYGNRIPGYAWNEAGGD